MDGGASWTARNTGLTNLNVRALAIDPVMPSILYAGTDGNGVFKLQQVNADLSVTMTDAPDPVVEGTSLTYTVTVANAGPGAAPEVTLTDPLSLGMTFSSATASQGSCTSGSGEPAPAVTVTCTLGAIPTGASATVTLVVVARQVIAPFPGTIPSFSNTATVSSLALDPDLANNTATASTTVAVPQVILGVTIAGTGSGTVTSSPSGISCTSGPAWPRSVVARR